jgi:hypothetical protein
MAAIVMLGHWAVLVLEAVTAQRITQRYRATKAIEQRSYMNATANGQLNSAQGMAKGLHMNNVTRCTCALT